MINAINLSKKLDDNLVLDELNLTVSEASIYGLIGSNGAGKSTLLNILSGVYKVDSGEIKMYGEDIYENTKIKEKIAYITDDPYYFNGATVEEMAKFLDKTYDSFDINKFYTIAKMFPIDIFKKFTTFSKGMRRQASIILALSQNPKLLLCDESFDGLDPVIRQMVKKLIVSEVAGNNMTVIISSHNLRELENLCDTIGILHGNKIIVEKSLSDIKDGIHKFQFAFNPMIDIEQFKNDFPVVSINVNGKFLEAVLRGNADELTNSLSKLQPVLMERTEISLEDIFIYEMEVNGYDFSKILL